MIATLCANDIDDFRALVTRKLGLFFDDTKSDFLADVIRQRMSRAGCDHFAAYERRISAMRSDSGDSPAGNPVATAATFTLLPSSARRAVSTNL